MYESWVCGEKFRTCMSQACVAEGTSWIAPLRKGLAHSRRSPASLREDEDRSAGTVEDPLLGQCPHAGATATAKRLSSVVIDWDQRILDEAREAGPTLEQVVHRFAELAPREKELHRGPLPDAVEHRRGGMLSQLRPQRLGGRIAGKRPGHEPIDRVHDRLTTAPPSSTGNAVSDVLARDAPGFTLAHCWANAKRK